MLRKLVFIMLAVAMVLGVGFVPDKAALAQHPEPPTLEGQRPGTPPAIDYANLPAPMLKANQLHTSLNADQAAAMARILEAHMPEFKEIMLALTAQGKSDGEAKPVDKAIADRLVAALNAIDSDLALVLTADQMDLYRAVMQPEIMSTSNPAAPADNGTSYYTDYCFYGAYYDAYAMFYGYYGYVNAYYNWYLLYYYGYTYYYAYDAYYWSYYGWVYSTYALDYSGPNYFSLLYFGVYTVDYPYYAYYYSDYAEYYTYYAYIYSYYAYYYDYSFTEYAYYAQLYDYYAWYGAYYGEYNTYYCYYYG